MSAAQYLNRRFDVLALAGAQPQGNVRLRQELFDAAGGRVCAGIQKLAQRWILEFMTARGSIPLQPHRGVDFLAIARRSGFRHEQDARAEYNFAAVRIKQILQNEEVPGMQDDERLDRDELLGLLLGPQFLSLRVRLVSRAGDSREAILPIPLSPVITTSHSERRS